MTREGTPSNDEGSAVTCHGVVLDGGVTVRSKAVVLTTGTFLRGSINFGTETFPGMVLILLDYPFPCYFSDSFKHTLCPVKIFKDSFLNKAILEILLEDIDGVSNEKCRFSAGRMGDEPSVGLARTLEGLDFRLGRMKTGTPPRLAKDTIDFSQTEVNRGDEVPVPFSFLNQKVTIDPTDQVWPHILIRFYQACCATV